jgi:anthranilate phosphoribosyltransferase
VLLNAGAGLVVAGRANDLRDGIAIAADVIDRGAAAALLQRLRVARRTHEDASREAEGAPA